MENKYEKAICQLTEMKKYVTMTDEWKDSIDVAIGLMRKEVAQTVVNNGERTPRECPRCGQSLSEHYGNGYFTHNRHLKHCPRCGQSLDWRGVENGMDIYHNGRVIDEL